MAGSYENWPRVLFIHFYTVIFEVYVLAKGQVIERDIVFGEILFNIWAVQFCLFNLCLKNLFTIQFDYLVQNFFELSFEVNVQVTVKNEL